MFSMKYCVDCLKPYAERIEADARYLLLNIPIEDDFGCLFNATLAIATEDFRALLTGQDRIVDLADHATLLTLENKRPHPARWSEDSHYMH